MYLITTDAVLLPEDDGILSLRNVALLFYIETVGPHCKKISLCHYYIVGRNI